MPNLGKQESKECIDRIGHDVSVLNLDGSGRRRDLRGQRQKEAPTCEDLEQFHFHPDGVRQGRESCSGPRSRPDKARRISMPAGPSLGSCVVNVLYPSERRYASVFCTCVVDPEPSMPSTTIKRPTLTSPLAFCSSIFEAMFSGICVDWRSAETSEKECRARGTGTLCSR